jgi:lipid-binding SYLF domain-containing protein
MRHCVRRNLFIACSVLALGAAGQVHAQAREEARLIIATQVVEELRATPDQYVPDLLLQRAYGIAVIPEVKKAAFGLGAQLGRGVLVVRDKQGRFTNPAFLTLAGGSIGWQMGVTETDIVLVFTSRAGIEGIAGGKLTLGADASAAAGPVGRSATASTDMNFTAEVYSYSRSRGLFAGIALDGTVLRIDRAGNADFYRKPRVATADILAGTVTSDSETVKRFLRAIASTTQAPAAAAEPSSQAPPPAAAPAGVPAPASGAKTFPMEDPQPGKEPGK